MTKASRWSVAAAGAALALICGWLWWQTAWNPRIPFLPAGAPAAWIVYPTPTDYQSYPPIELTARFGRSFHLDRAPASARLAVRGFRNALVVLNGRTVSTPHPAGNWKEVTYVDVGPFLRPGENQLHALVRNRGAPSALWLQLEGEGLSLVSDGNWTVSLAGAAESPAHLARMPLPTPREVLPFDTPLASLRNRWTWILTCLALSVAGTLAVWFGWPLGFLSGARPVSALFVLIALFWALSARHNQPWIASSYGFDAGGHLDYVDFVARNGSLPLATDGWEMFQPPLYYLFGAMALGTLGESASTEAGASVLRSVSLVGGLAQLTFLWLSFRLLFPNSPFQQAIALVVTGLLPAHLYLHQYVTNEGWAAAWTTGAIYFTLRLIKANAAPFPAPAPSSLVDGTGLGICLGLGLLTKLTPAIVGLVLLGTLCGQMLVGRTTSLRAWTERVLLPVALAALLAGWHYARVGYRFGDPFIANWDQETGFAWWQQPGFQTRESLSRFGQVFVEPFLVGGRGLLDGIYATLWGDGGLGGSTQPWIRPPWNYDLMEVGYLLAAIPSLLIVLGALATFIGFLRRPTALDCVLLGVAAGLGLAILGMNLALPYYSLAKGFFAIGGSVSLGAFAAGGMAVLVRHARWLALSATMLLGVWAINAGATFWVIPHAPKTLLSQASGLLNAKNGTDRAEPILRRLLDQDPNEPSALTLLAMLLAQKGDTVRALDLLTRACQADPSDAGAPIGRAILLSNLGRDEEALALARPVISAHPDYQSAWALLGQLLRKKGDLAGAASAYREALRLQPTDPEVHGALAVLYRDQQQPIPAIEHAEYARALGKQDPDIEIAQAEALTILGRLPEAQQSLQAAITNFEKSGLDAIRLREHQASLSEKKSKP